VDYWSGTGAPDPSDDFWVAAKREYFRSALGLFENLVKGRRLLDIGGGVGFFAELALARGWDAYSLDTSPVATENAAARIGPNRAISTLDGLLPDPVDVLTFWCVIAHTRDPRELMVESSRVLRPGGIIWITTPNFDFQKPYSFSRTCFGKPIDFDAEDHVGHFTPRSLRSLLVASGFSAPIFHFCGVNETSLMGCSPSKLEVHGKRSWNCLTFTLAQLGLPNYMSELQATARLR